MTRFSVADQWHAAAHSGSLSASSGRMPKSWSRAWLVPDSPTSAQCDPPVLSATNLSRFGSRVCCGTHDSLPAIPTRRGIAFLGWTYTAIYVRKCDKHADYWYADRLCRLWSRYIDGAVWSFVPHCTSTAAQVIISS